MSKQPAQDREATLAELAELAGDIAFEPITDAAAEKSRGALRRQQDHVMANPIALAAYERTMNRILQRNTVLRELRKARSLTQAEIGRTLGMNQSEVSRLEQRSDLLLSTLKRYVAATGGELHLVVTYPDTPPLDVELTEASTT